MDTGLLQPARGKRRKVNVKGMIYSKVYLKVKLINSINQ